MRRNDNKKIAEENVDSVDKQQMEISAFSSAKIEQELTFEEEKRHNRRILRNGIFTLITIAAAAVLIATLVFPILRIYGTSMTPSIRCAAADCAASHPGRWNCLPRVGAEFGKNQSPGRSESAECPENLERRYHHRSPERSICGYSETVGRQWHPAENQ